jgi:hypothetical protein
MAELVATLAKLVLLLEDTVHGSDGAKIHPLVEQSCVDLLGCLVEEAW